MSMETQMLTKFVRAGLIASMVMTGLAATPAAAHGRYDRAYDYNDRGYPYEGRWSRGEGRYDRGRTYDYDDGRGYRDRRYRHHNSRCGSGTTGAILGAVAGGLLGREIGRGGRYNRGSTTGLIIGAGTNALVGREIDRNGNCR